MRISGDCFANFVADFHTTFVLVSVARVSSVTSISCVVGGPRGRVVKVADFSALDHSIISPMLVRASHGARIHMRDKPCSACGCVRWFFPGYSGFRPTYRLIRLDMSEKA